MTDWEHDPWAVHGYDLEAIEIVRVDVDAELAEMNAAADALHAAEARGVCPHWSLTGMRCANPACGRVFRSDEEWGAVQDAIASGEPV